jgi:2-C-methyl-D-erythritol 4-phosphate cytidylyltransferase
LLGGKPLLAQSAALFERHPAVDHIVVAVPEQDLQRVRNVLRSEDITKLRTVVPGGASRQDSVYAAFQALPGDVDIVLVHDGVRPFVLADQVSDVIETIEEHGAAALAIPVADTLRFGRGEAFGDTAPRDHLYRMQTPQGSRLDWFKTAFTNARRSAYASTDDVDLMRRAGFEVRIVEGSSLNFKITTRADWDLACIIWPDWERAEK